MAQKKLYFRIYDIHADVGMTATLNACMQWIKNDCEDEKVNDSEKEYIITPVWLTAKEFKNLPEVDL